MNYVCSYASVKEKAHKFTMKAFADNQPYMIVDTKTPPWGKRHPKEGEEYDVKRDLDKLLGLGLYAQVTIFISCLFLLGQLDCKCSLSTLQYLLAFLQWNPIVSKFNVQVEPMVGVFEVALCTYRSLYNIFTWRDPFLSFWVSICCTAAIAVLLLFPRRAIFFVVGMVGLGPQNLLIRLVREFLLARRRRQLLQPQRPGRFMRALRELLRSTDSNGSKEQTKKKSPKKAPVPFSPQPIFFCNSSSASRANTEQNIGAQHICVPYSPLYCHRFYDWPTDPKFARILKETPIDSSTLYSSQTKFITVVPQLPQSKGELKKTKDAPGETKEVPAPIQTPRIEAKETKPAPPVTSTSSTETSSRPEIDESTCSEPKNTEEVSTASSAENNVPVVKAWSQAVNNLNKAFAKGGQAKEKSEKKTTQEEGEAKEEDFTGIKSPIAGISMGERPDIRWWMGTRKSSQRSNQEDEDGTALVDSIKEEDDEAEPSEENAADGDNPAPTSDQSDGKMTPREGEEPFGSKSPLAGVLGIGNCPKDNWWMGKNERVEALLWA